MKKSSLIILLFVMSVSVFAEMSRYNFNFGYIKLRECVLSHKKNGRRKFKGKILNRYSKDLELVELKFYFKDKQINHGREIFVSSEYIKDIPKTSETYFYVSIPVGEVDDRNFRVELGEVRHK